MAFLNRGFSATLNSQTWLSTEGQTIFNITNGKYTPNKNLIEVYVAGIRQDSGDGYTETSSTSFTLAESIPAGTYVEARWFENTLPAIGVGHSTTHKAGGQDELNVKDLAGYDQMTTKSQLDTSVNSLNTRINTLTANTQDLNNRPLRGIGLYFNNYDTATLNKLVGLLKTYSDMGFDSIAFYADFQVNSDLTLNQTFLNTIISYYNQLVPYLSQYNFKHVMLRAGRQNHPDATANPTTYFNSIKSGLQQLIQGISYTFNSLVIANEEPLQTTNVAYTTNWQTLIAYLRTIYSGQITISAMMSEIFNVTFLNSLDVIGCNNYPTLSFNADITQLTDQELRQNFWVNGNFTNLLGLYKTYGKKIVIVESGCMTTQYAHIDPGFSGLTGTQDGKSQNRYWRTALPMFDGMSFLSGYFMFDGITNGYSPIASTSDPTLQTYIHDYFKLGVINHG